ncbi:MAG TPA: cobalamin-binding protein, partial [Oscillospiraceae bacterium]|nr:cobalamin-binding protein [Oscillospiraceae bacterium]
MKNFAEEFKQILETENKEKAVEYALDLLKEKKIGVIGLYSEILAPALNNMYCSLSDKDVCIWKEHVRTAIVR